MHDESCFRPQGYHSSNPYHNGVHAADVTQAMNCFLQENSIRRHLRPVETMAALVAAVCHDLDHPGKNEKFLIATRNPLTCMYGDSSVLENHHWRAAVALMRETGFMEAIEAAGEGADFQVLGGQISYLCFSCSLTIYESFPLFRCSCGMSS